MASKSRRFLLPLVLLLLAPVISPEGYSAAPAGPKFAIPSLEHSFGEVKPGTPLLYTFEFKNLGDAPLYVLNVAPSCGCTTTKFDKEVAPGKSGGITLSVEKTDGYQGEVVKTATVTTNDAAKKTFTLVLKAIFKK